MFSICITAFDVVPTLHALLLYLFAFLHKVVVIYITIKALTESACSILASLTLARFFFVELPSEIDVLFWRLLFIDINFSSSTSVFAAACASALATTLPAENLTSCCS